MKGGLRKRIQPWAHGPLDLRYAWEGGHVARPPFVKSIVLGDLGEIASSP